jgi:predicted membrane channel-forming protein YqfA (hemolysin III family)
MLSSIIEDKRSNIYDINYLYDSTVKSIQMSVYKSNTVAMCTVVHSYHRLRKSKIKIKKCDRASYPMYAIKF